MLGLPDAITFLDAIDIIASPFPFASQFPPITIKWSPHMHFYFFQVHSMPKRKYIRFSITSIFQEATIEFLYHGTFIYAFVFSCFLAFPSYRKIISDFFSRIFYFLKGMVMVKNGILRPIIDNFCQSESVTKTFSCFSQACFGPGGVFRFVWPSEDHQSIYLLSI